MEYNRYEIFNDAIQRQHILIAGCTGSGKSVVVNGLIYTMLSYSHKKYEYILIDPKRVELVSYKDTMHCIKYASEPKAMIETLQYSLDLIDKRHKVMSRKRLKTYQGSTVYIIIDELADLLKAGGTAVSKILDRILMIGRAAKVFVIGCTQSILAKVIPSELQANFDTRILLRTANIKQSRLVGIADLHLLPKYGKAYYINTDNTQGVLVSVPYIQDDTLQQAIKHNKRLFKIRPM